MIFVSSRGLVHVCWSVIFSFRDFGWLVFSCAISIYLCVSVWLCFSCYGNCGVCMFFSQNEYTGDRLDIFSWVSFVCLHCFTHYIKRKVTFNVFVSQSIDVVFFILICCYFFIVLFLLCFWLLRFSLVPLILFVFFFFFVVFNLGFSENSKLTIIYM